MAGAQVLCTTGGTVQACFKTEKRVKKLVRMLRGHLDGVLAWTKLRLSNGALEGMNNKIKLVSHRAFGFRSVQHYVAAIYHCCAQLPLPQES